MDNVPLSNIFKVKGRFQRSVHLERDFYTENALDGYILTVTAREMLSRVALTLENETTSKAWSLTGPYGSGKSAFALFAAKLLGNPYAPTTEQALGLLKRGDVPLYERFISTNGHGQFSLRFLPGAHLWGTSLSTYCPSARLRTGTQEFRNFIFYFTSAKDPKTIENRYKRDPTGIGHHCSF